MSYPQAVHIYIWTSHSYELLFKSSSYLNVPTMGYYISLRTYLTIIPTIIYLLNENNLRGTTTDKTLWLQQIDTLLTHFRINADTKERVHFHEAVP